eukprot:4338173-Amphidinium_carterae.1
MQSLAQGVALQQDACLCSALCVRLVPIITSPSASQAPVQQGDDAEKSAPAASPQKGDTVESTATPVPPPQKGEN